MKNSGINTRCQRDEAQLHLFITAQRRYVGHQELDENSLAITDLKDSITHIKYWGGSYIIERTKHYGCKRFVFRIYFQYRNAKLLPLLQKHIEECVVCYESLNDFVLKFRISRTPDTLAHAVWSETDMEGNF